MPMSVPVLFPCFLHTNLLRLKVVNKSCVRRKDKRKKCLPWKQSKNSVSLAAFMDHHSCVEASRIEIARRRERKKGRGGRDGV